MQQTCRYQSFLESELLWKTKPFLDLAPFEFTERAYDKNNQIQIDIPANEVLGKRIERYFEYYLQQTKRYQLLAKNIQIFKDKITIGELDFIIRDQFDDTLIHLELVYKFYLYDPNLKNSTHNAWIGPNRKDNLVKKIKKLREHQLPLLHTPEAEKILNTLQLDPHKMIQKVAFFAQLYTPKTTANLGMKELNSVCVQGYWIDRNGFTQNTYGNYQFYIPTKKDWIVHPKSNRDWEPFDSIYEVVIKLLSQKRSPLIWAQSDTGSLERFFIVWWK